MSKKKTVGRPKNSTKRIKEIKEEIYGYNIRKPIANAMLKLGEMGFDFSGHGCGCGGEDFGLVRKDLYVNFCDTGRTCKVTINTNPEDNDIEIQTLFEGTIKKALKFIDDNIKLLGKRVAY